MYGNSWTGGQACTWTDVRGELIASPQTGIPADAPGAVYNFYMLTNEQLSVQVALSAYGRGLSAEGWKGKAEEPSNCREAVKSRRTGQEQKQKSINSRAEQLLG